MKISVLLSLFAKENPQFFDSSMKSIWDDQSRKPDEIVLVEDGPLTVELDEIVRKWKEKLGDILKVVPLKENKGLAIALNEGAKQCTGDYIARMDTDDISMPNRFEVQEKYLMEHKDIVVLGGGMIEFNDEEGDYPARMMPVTYEEIMSTIGKTSPFVHPSVFIQKEVMEKGFTYNPNCRRCQDKELWYRIIAAKFRVGNVPEIVIKYRKDPLLYKKRKKSNGIEFKVDMRGIYQVYGLFSLRYIYPIAHYLFHLLPSNLSKVIYKRFFLRYWRSRNY